MPATRAVPCTSIWAAASAPAQVPSSPLLVWSFEFRRLLGLSVISALQILRNSLHLPLLVLFFSLLACFCNPFAHTRSNKPFEAEAFSSVALLILYHSFFPLFTTSSQFSFHYFLLLLRFARSNTHCGLPLNERPPPQTVPSILEPSGCFRPRDTSSRRIAPSQRGSTLLRCTR